MLRVLLVDDEPLILMGIKTMLDWQALDLELVGSARNGQQALAEIESLRPDIVIADINMPVMGGIELLKLAGERFPEVVFVMLTNLQEFELARECLRSRAVDYLVKTQLDQDTLQECLQKAARECELRGSLMRNAVAEHGARTNWEQLLEQSVRLMRAPSMPREALDVLIRAGILERYLMIEVLLRFPERHVPDVDDLFHWEQQVVRELARNCFPRGAAVSPDPQNLQMTVLIWGDQAFDEQVDSFHKKLQVASGDITGIEPCLLVSSVHSGQHSIAQCRQELAHMQNEFYLTARALIRAQQCAPSACPPLGLKGLVGSFKKELNARSAPGCQQLLDRAAHRIESEPHEKAQAVWLCTELCFAANEITRGWPELAGHDGLLGDDSRGYQQIKQLATRGAVLHFLRLLGNELQALLEPGGSRHGDIVEQVKRYIEDHLGARIALNQAAQAVFLSPGYLSALFKKQCGESFVDYVNRRKVERACEMLRVGNLRICEVADALSFENAYYFARVFKRHMGLTPSEYQERGQQ